MNDLARDVEYRSSIGIYAWCRDLDETPGGIEAFVGHLARYLAAANVPVVVHCLAADTAGWHVRDGEFHLGGDLTTSAPGLYTYRPAHGPGAEGAVIENMAVSERYDEQVIVAFGTRDRYVFDLATAVARQRRRPAVAVYYHSVEERQFRAQFADRAPGISGLASMSERSEFEERAAATVRRFGEDFAAVVVPTEHIRQQVSGTMRAETTPIVIAYHGPDPDVFPPRAEPWDGRGPWLHVSRCSVPNALHKNFLWSCELVRHVVRRRSALADGARLELCGRGNAASLVRAFGVQNALDDRLDIAGELTQRELAARYRAASFLLVPSMMEAGATVIVEAVLSGCVPIVLDHGGSGEVMRTLGLEHLLVPGVAQRMPYVVVEATPTASSVDLVVPDMRMAVSTMERCVHHPRETGRSLAAARTTALEKLTLGPSVEALDTGLRRAGIDLRLVSPSVTRERVEQVESEYRQLPPRR